MATKKKNLSHERENSKKPRRHKKRDENNECTRAMTVFEHVNAPVRPAVAKENDNVKIKKDMMLLDVESKHTTRPGCSNEKVSSKEKLKKDSSSKERVTKKEKDSSKERIEKKGNCRDSRSKERVTKHEKGSNDKHHGIHKIGSSENIGGGHLKGPPKGKRNQTKRSEDGLGPRPRNRNVSTPPVGEPVKVSNSMKIKSKTGSSTEDTSKDDRLLENLEKEHREQEQREKEQKEKEQKEKEQKEQHQEPEHVKTPLELIADIPDDACFTAHQPIDKVRYKVVCYNGVKRYEVDTTYVPPPEPDEKKDGAHTPEDKLNIYSPPTSPTPPTSPMTALSPQPVAPQTGAQTPSPAVNASAPPPAMPQPGAAVPVFPVRYKAVMVNGIRRFVPDVASGPVGSPAAPSAAAKPSIPYKPSESAIPTGYKPLGSQQPIATPATSPAAMSPAQPVAPITPAPLVTPAPPTTPAQPVTPVAQLPMTAPATPAPIQAPLPAVNGVTPPKDLGIRNINGINYRMVVVNGVKRYEPMH